MPQQSAPTAEGITLKHLIVPTMKIFLPGMIAFGVILFLAAGTLNYWQAWVFLIVFNGLLSVSTAYFAIKDPALIERRKNVVEPRLGQKIFSVIAAGTNLVVLPVFSALDHRFGWSQMPVSVCLIGDGLIVVANVIYYYVFQFNSFVGSTIQIFEGQKVISTGPYALVRHPKYVGDLFLVIGIPLALGSWWGLVIIAVITPLLAWRILDEESLLKKDLPGYVEYMQKIHYRLVPYLW